MVMVRKDGTYLFGSDFRCVNGVIERVLLIASGCNIEQVARSALFLG